MGTIRSTSELLKAEPSVPRTTGKFAGERRMMRVIHRGGSVEEMPYSMCGMADALLKIYDPESTAIGYELEGWDY